MSQSVRPIACKPDPGAANATGPATVLEKSVVGHSARNARAGEGAIEESLPKIPKTPKTPKTPRAAHPMGETAKIRTGLPVSCWRCQQDSNYFLNGAQKYQMWGFRPDAPQAGTGTSLAEIASMIASKKTNKIGLYRAARWPSPLASPTLPTA